ncbi:MAG: TonB-dependent receptor [Verrucomicrobia bacterium]|nr:TonB-dependent receptor [Verrucomicrobiota bacterium]
MNSWRSSLLRWLLPPALTVMLACCPVTAQPAGSGAVSGRVSHAATGAYLEGAEVSLGGGTPVLTDRNGAFFLPGVPAGAQRLRVFYTGLDVATPAVEVRSGQTATVEVALTSNVLQLEAFTVSADREGEAASITRQRTAANVVNVVSTDAFGSVADGNIGNLMVRLPGVTGEFENGEVVGIRLRGTPVEFSALNVDGVRAAGAFSGFNTQGDRGAQSDQIPAEFIKEVEVTKAPTPDQPADSIGGSTNLVTKSALDFKEDVLTYRVGFNYNAFREDLQNLTPNAALTYLTRIGRARDIGLAVSLSYTDTEAPRDRVQTARTFEDGRATQARSLSNVNQRVRMGGGLKFDYRLGADLSVYLKLQYNYYYFDSPRQVYAASVAGSGRVADYSRVSRAQIEAGTAARDSANQTAGVAPGFTDSFTEMVSATWLNEATWNVKLGRQYLSELGAVKKFGGDQSLTGRFTYNPSNFASNLRSFDLNLQGNIGMSIDTRANRSRPLFRQTYGPTIGPGTDWRNYRGRLLQQPESSEETMLNATLDYVKDFRGRELPLQFKAGGAWRRQDRTLRVARPNWTFTGADRVAGPVAATGVNDDNLAQFILPEPAHPLFDQRNGVWPDLPGINFPAVWRAFSDHPEWFAAEGTSVSAAPTVSDITEDIFGLYAQGRLQIGRLNLLGGVRFEETRVGAEANNTDPRNPAVARVRRQRSYNDYFPGLHLRYAVRPNLTARASVTTGAARPNMSDLYPTTTVSYNATTGLGTVTQNAAGLRPQHSLNYDLTLEYYLEPAGLFSVGYFRKNITRFLVRTSDEIDYGPDNGFDGAFGGFTLNTTSTGGKAKVEGWETNYTQQLRFLPRPFNGFAIFGNYTSLKTEGIYATGARALAGFIPRTANAGTTFRWRKLEARLAWRSTSAQLRSYNANIYSQSSFRPYETTDFSLKYAFSPRYGLYFDAINIGNNWPQNYTGEDQGRVTFADDYGRRFNVGLTGRF